ncbi:MAG: 4-hydroxybenzoate octaprenyltransferase [Gammaproteobacteria bacterium]|nr:4-hydroxybenzoate octaprenyltransferase [Gammaproteobacteria bacterium]
MGNYIALLRLNKPIGILLLLWPTLWALWLAACGMPDLKILLIFVFGVIVMRSAGCVINDIADRDFDRYVMRTQERPITSGKIALREAYLIFLLLVSLAFGLVSMLNYLTMALACVGIIFVMVYPLLKRVTHLPQLGLGVTFSWGIPMAFSAVNGYLETGTGWLFLTAVVWTLMYDTLYAMTDRQDDIKIGLHSTAILFGRYDRLVIFLLQSLVLALLFYCGIIFQLGKFYSAMLILVATLFFYQQYLIRERDPLNCFRAFLNNNWVGLIIFLGIVNA